MSKNKPDKSHFRPFCADGRTSRCQAFSKSRPGEQCLKPAKNGYRVCDMHGAGKGNKNGGRPPEPDKPTSRYNPASPKFSPERAFVYDTERIPANLRARFTRIMNNPHIMEINHELIVVQARLEQLLERIDDTAPLDRIRAAFDAVDTALRGGDVTGLQTGMLQLRRAIETAETGEDRANWQEIRSVIRDKAALVDQGRRHRIENKTMITVEEYANSMRHIQALVLQHVKDPDARKELAREFRAHARATFQAEQAAFHAPQAVVAASPVTATDLN